MNERPNRIGRRYTVICKTYALNIRLAGNLHRFSPCGSPFPGSVLDIGWRLYLVAHVSGFDGDPPRSSKTSEGL
jgi:hypothetical protein